MMATCANTWHDQKCPACACDLYSKAELTIEQRKCGDNWHNGFCDTCGKVMY